MFQKFLLPIHEWEPTQWENSKKSIECELAQDTKVSFSKIYYTITEKTVEQHSNKNRPWYVLYTLKMFWLQNVF